MKRFTVFILSAALVVLACGGPRVAGGPDFDAYFVDKTMRVDFFHTGHATEDLISLDRVYQQGIWAGSRVNLIDPFNLGRYFVKVYDEASGKLIFSRGFDNYFGEYKTSDAALQGVRRTYHETALVPYPLKPVRFTVKMRDRENVLRPLFSQVIDPAASTIIKESLAPGVRVYEVVKSGPPHRKVDLAFVAEGYTEAEEAKLWADLDRFAAILFTLEPYKSNREKFNIYGVFKPSAESGCGEPSHGVFKSTSIGATFDSLGSERYLLTEDNRSLRDIAAHVPYDTLAIMVNHDRYGGGGIYNFYCTFTTDNQWHEYLFLHEFGHSFAGLADEYYTSEVAYNEFYPRGVEPVEPNITALLDPARLKWAALVTPGIEIPTPWEKAEFDRMDNANQKKRSEINARIARMKREGAPPADVAKAEDEAERLSQKHAAEADAFLRKSRYWDKVGAFEGAGYSSEGLFRPQLDCLMFSKGTKPFCKVCEDAVLRMIRYFTE